MKRNKSKRILALVLSMVLLLSSSISAMAEGEEKSSETAGGIVQTQNLIEQETENSETGDQTQEKSQEDQEQTEELEQTEDSAESEKQEESVRNEETELRYDITDENGSIVSAITAYIQEGSFEADASAIAMEVKQLDQDEEAYIKSLMEEQLPQDTYVGDWILYDITFLVNGELTDPMKEITLTYENPDIAISDVQDAVVCQYNVADSKQGREKDSVTEIIQREDMLRTMEENGEDTSLAEEHDLSQIFLREDGAVDKIQMEVRKSSIFGCYVEKTSEAADFTGQAGNAEITVHVPEGAFDTDAANVTMTAKEMTEEEITFVNEQLKGQAPDGQEVQEYAAYEIQLWADGQEIQPQKAATVTVRNTGLNLEQAADSFLFQYDAETDSLIPAEGTLDADGSMTFQTQKLTLMGAGIFQTAGEGLDKEEDLDGDLDTEPGTDSEENTESKIDKTESTEPESTESESTEQGSLKAEGTDLESVGEEDTEQEDAEKKDTEKKNTEPESTGTESKESGNTESKETESGDTENTDQGSEESESKKSQTGNNENFGETATEQKTEILRKSRAVSAQTLESEEEEAAQPAALAEEGDTYINGGTIEGTEITWEYTEDREGVRTLTIAGTGAIPNYSNENRPPWYNHLSGDNGKQIKVVIQPGITQIGTYAFAQGYVSSYELPDTLTKIDERAFVYNRSLRSITIPGSVKEIGSRCFEGSTGISEFVLEEGVETLGVNIFTKAQIQTLSLPSTLKSVNGGFGALDHLESIEVAEGNDSFKVVDGVLFQKQTEDTWALLTYPACRQGISYEVPEEIEEMKVTNILRAFASTQYLHELTIPGGVEITGYAFQGSSVSKVTIGEGVLTQSTYAFIEARSLTEVDISGLSGTLPSAFFMTCPSLASIYIPQGITRIGSSAFGSCTGLTEVTYDAANATWNTLYPPMGTSAMPRYELTIGKHVDQLNAEFFQIAERAESINFEEENRITIADGALKGAPAPFDTLSGEIYIDKNGVIYTLDDETKEAAVSYCPPGNTKLQIPASIEPEDGESYSITAVKKDALKTAEGLQSITFEAPETIKTLEAYALANCPTLTEVNGKETEEEARASFTNASLGYNVFYNTGLTGASGSGSFAQDMDGKKSLTVEMPEADNMEITVQGGETMSWQSAETEEAGGYTLLTGDTMTVITTVGGTVHQEDIAYRVYFQLTDGTGSLSVTPGSYRDFDGQRVYYYGTEDPNTVYMEFTPNIGGTISVPATATYPSPETAGGGLKVWGMVLSKEKAEESKEEIIESEEGENIQAFWSTQADEFSVSKTSTKENITVVGDGKGGALPAANLGWSIQLQRTSEQSSAYGKDYVSTVDYTDVMTLSEDISWKSEVLEAVEEGKLYVRWSGTTANLYADQLQIASLNIQGGSMQLGSIRAECRDKELIFHWKVKNQSEETEISTNNLTFTIYAQALSVDMEKFNIETGETISNEIEAKVHYHYRQDLLLEDEAAVQLKGGAAEISLLKEGTSATYFGEAITYTLTLSNQGGLPWTGVAAEDGDYRISDTLSEYSYITPENMERMFEDTYGDDLKIIIEKAALADWNPVAGTKGSEDLSWQHSGNSDIDDAQNQKILWVWKTAEGNITAAVIENGEVIGKSKTAETIEEVLREIGYAADRDATYTCQWSLSETNQAFTMQGGESREYKIYASAKDSFQMISKKDWPNEYPVEESVQINNSDAKILMADGSKKDASIENTARTRVKREAVVEKSVYKDGKMLAGSFGAEDQDVLEYRVQFWHYGSGSYEDLPMVDDLYGSQYLLVPKDENPSLAEKNLGTVERDGISYYILTEGNYEDVVVGRDQSSGAYLTAASITVERAEENTAVDAGDEKQEYTGLHTQIKWYYSHLEGGNYKIEVRYQALVDMQLAQGGSYTIGNVVWMNDKRGSRIYDGLWGGGSIIDFAKDIVLERDEENPENDLLDEDGYSVVGPGESVTYRLTLRNKGNGTYILKGTDLADALPDTYDVFSWEKGENILEFDCKLTGDENTKAVNLDKWYIGSEYGGFIEERQYILWGEDAQITFVNQSVVYLYFTLSYPEENDWNRYTDEVGGSMIDNTLYVYRFPSVVSHELKEAGEVLLQKGVYGNVRYAADQSTSYENTGSRLYYNNKDSWRRGIVYYAALYNGGNKRLYLNTLYDALPEGITYRTMISDGDYSKANAVPAGQKNAITTKDSSQNITYPLAEIQRLQEQGESVSYRNATITAIATEQGVKFTIGGGTGECAVKYDEERQQYYLDKGEAIVFGYICEISSTEETEQYAENTIAMPYSDYQQTGLVPIDKENVFVTAPADHGYTDVNDGSRSNMSDSNIESAYGFDASEDTDQWLISQVTVSRGGIIPGVVKYAESYTTTGGVTTKYENSVPSDAVVNWRVRLRNTGTLSVTDYTFTDSMPAPYSFTGNVGYKIYGSSGTVVAYADSMLTLNRSGDTITVQSNTDTQKLEIGGESKSLLYTQVTSSSTSGRVQVSITMDKDSNGNEKMSLQFKDPLQSIPEGGYMEITFSSQNLTTTVQNTVYTNQAFFTPNKQTFDSVCQGSMVKDAEGNPESVRNTAPINVSEGYATNSEKKVTESENPDNTAVSTDADKNYILLPGENSAFQYTLSVKNTTDYPMEKLVLIDNLPETGDHSPFDTEVPRNSDFQIDFADDPDVQVKITDESGSEQQLDSDSYIVQYSKDTDFGGRQSADWKGETNGTTAEWSNSSTDARSVRIMILDEGGAEKLIPANATVSVTFSAKIQGEAAPGTLAWNSFGYHYKLAGITAELEAMPLVVGVKVPSVPTLVKELVDAKGQPVNAPENTEFHYIVYKGEALNGEYETEEALKTALETEQRQYKAFTVTVDKGENKSEAISLASESWNWESGEKYTIVEIPDNQDYALNGFNHTSQMFYTFTYDPDQQIAITCQNEYLLWAADLTKQDSQKTDKKLSGAVFALYSPVEKDQMEEIPDEYKELIISETVTTGEGDHAQTWYLAAIKTTGTDGTLSWEQLRRDQYYLLEVKAPEGYALNAVPWQILDKTAAEQGLYSLTVENTQLYELPSSGGPGIFLHMIGGILLLMAGSLMIYMKRRKGVLKE